MSQSFRQICSRCQAVRCKAVRPAVLRVAERQMIDALTASLCPTEEQHSEVSFEATGRFWVGMSRVRLPWSVQYSLPRQNLYQVIIVVFCSVRGRGLRVVASQRTAMTGGRVCTDAGWRRSRAICCFSNSMHLVSNCGCSLSYSCI